MDYVRITWGDKIGLYRLTSSYTDEPYLRVSDSYLPLTTNTSNMIGETQPKIIMNGMTYRPLRCVSSSSSTTFLTTSTCSSNMHDTTAITGEVTTGTIYHTCSSTSSTEYLTRSSTSSIEYGTSTQALLRALYLSLGKEYYSGTKSGLVEVEYDTYQLNDSRASINYSYTQSSTRTYFNMRIAPYSPFQRWYSTLSFTKRMANVIFHWYQEPGWAYSVFTEGVRGYSSESRENIIGLAFGSYSSGVSMSKFRFEWVDSTANNETVSHDRAEASNVVYSFNNTLSVDKYIYLGSYSVNTRQHLRLRVRVRPEGTITTGTTYHTCSSTYSTIYHTRSSTSRIEYLTSEATTAYSGVYFSSVSATDGWV